MRALPTAGDLGAVATAMVTPFDAGGRVDPTATQALARHLTVDGWNDTLVVNGTTGEAITTSDAEKQEVIEAVVAAVGPRVRVIAGVGTSDTRHSIALAQQAEAAGAGGLLVVTPYYSRPSLRGILDHFRAIADATSLPVMLYDIPKRSGVGLDEATVVALAEHPSVVSLKDAKGDLEFASWVLRETDLTVYSGDDALNLPFLAIGARGFVSVAGHVVGNRLRDMLTAYRVGDVEAAWAIHLGLLPVYRGLFRQPGVASTKAALAALGLPVGGVRSPLASLRRDEVTVLMADLAAGGLPVDADVLTVPSLV